MVIVFELFLLRGATVSNDKVMGWGAFPITDGGFDVVEGKLVIFSSFYFEVNFFFLINYLNRCILNSFSICLYPLDMCKTLRS